MTAADVQVNGPDTTAALGGTPGFVVSRKLRKLGWWASDTAELAFDGCRVPVRNLIGPYITSLEMAGASITMLKMDDDMLKLWDAPVKTPGLRWGV